MAFSYDPTLATDEDKVRLLLRDTTEKDANGNDIYLFEDAEISGLLTYFESDVLHTAAHFYLIIAGDKSKLAVRYKLGADMDVDWTKAGDAARKQAEMLMDEARKEWSTSEWIELREKIDQYGRDRTEFYQGDKDEDEEDWELKHWEGLDTGF